MAGEAARVAVEPSGSERVFKGITEIEHARSGIARVDGNAARQLVQVLGRASDQRKPRRVAASELGSERVSNERERISQEFPDLEAAPHCLS
jgi:hypothetical protein